jgi:hypothetical protein
LRLRKKLATRGASGGTTGTRRDKIFNAVMKFQNIASFPFYLFLPFLFFYLLPTFLFFSIIAPFLVWTLFLHLLDQRRNNHDLDGAVFTVSFSLVHRGSD